MILSFQQINKSFGANHVLKDISFEASSGQAFGLLGRNGAGKTTCIRILMDVFKADSGRILLDGKPLNPQEHRFGYLPEEKGLYPKLQILRQMTYIGELRGLSHRDAKKSSLKWLDRLEMSQVAQRRLDTLSKGNQQKIQLAVALLTDPDIVVLDEPFSGLDPVNAQLLKEVVVEQVNAGKIVFFSSHQMSYVESFCEEVAILHRGKIVRSGTITGLRQSYPKDRLAIRLGENGQSLSAAETTERLTQFFREMRTANPAACPALVGEPQSFGLGASLQLRRASDLTDVLKALVANGFHLEQFAIIEPSLEDIFVESTGDLPEEGMNAPFSEEVKEVAP